METLQENGRQEPPGMAALPRGRANAQLIEEYLDGGAGNCHLARPEIAELVAQTLRQFDGTRYRLLAWCIMPNHVHVVFQPRAPFKLEKVVHTWKSYSAQMASRILKKKGHFWQREYYDHLIRDGQQLGRAIRYTTENPMKAGLRDWPWVFVAKDWS